MNQLILSTDLEFMGEGELDRLRPQIDEISRMIDALYKATKPYTPQLIYYLT